MVFPPQKPSWYQILGQDKDFLRFYVNFPVLLLIFYVKILHCNLRPFENLCNLRPESVFPPQKPSPCQILGQEIDFFRFYEGLCSFSEMAVCHTFQDGRINVGRVYLSSFSAKLRPACLLSALHI